MTIQVLAHEMRVDDRVLRKNCNQVRFEDVTLHGGAKGREKVLLVSKLWLGIEDRGLVSCKLIGPVGAELRISTRDEFDNLFPRKRFSSQGAQRMQNQFQMERGQEILKEPEPTIGSVVQLVENGEQSLTQVLSLST